ncbi:MAG: hypothetical protein ACR2QS_04480 [Woeseiaceae bacterium]
MKVGQIYLEKAANDGARQFQAIVEGLDRLAVEQHVLVASTSLARSLSGLPYVTVGPVVSTPVMAYCLIPEVDVAHVHDSKSGQTGLLLTLTRAVPYVITSTEPMRLKRHSMWASILNRAKASISSDELHPDSLIETYRRAIEGGLERPKEANGR